LRDLSGQFAALQMQPLGQKSFQGYYLKHGIKHFKPVYLLLKNLMIRHSKAAVEASGAMKLPPKTEEVIEINFREDEWRLYHQAHKSARAAFDQFATVSPSYCLVHALTIMSLLVPLRRLCSGGMFAPDSMHTDVRLKWHDQTVANAAHHNAHGVQGGEGVFPPVTDEVRFTILPWQVTLQTFRRAHCCCLIASAATEPFS
jgi:hypothetical protein